VVEIDLGGESHGSDTRTELHHGWEIANRKRTERYCVIPFLLPPPKTLAPQGPRKLPKLDVAGSTPVARSS